MKMVIIDMRRSIRISETIGVVNQIGNFDGYNNNIETSPANIEYSYI